MRPSVAYFIPIANRILHLEYKDQSNVYKISVKDNRDWDSCAFGWKKEQKWVQ
jgi:hypothetical protein